MKKKKRDTTFNNTKQKTGGRMFKNKSVMKTLSILIALLFSINSLTYAAPSTSTLRSSSALLTGVAPALGGDLIKASSAGALDQAELAKLYAAQKAGEWNAIQGSGLALSATLVADYQKRWQEKLAQIKESHPGFAAPFNAANPDAQSLEVTPGLAELFNILWDMMGDVPAGHLKELFEKSDNSTAGIRAYFDILNNENPSNMYNDFMYALLCVAEAEFLKEVHAKEIKAKIPNPSTKGFKELIQKLEANLDQGEIDIIKQIYGMEDKSLADVVAFIRENPVKLVGGEVRKNSSKLIEIETRIMAANGITVITPSRRLDDNGNPVYDSSTICMFSFLTYKLGACGATFLTPSHSACYVLGRKALGPSGQQLLPDTYEKYRNIIKRIVKNDIFGEGKSPVWEMAPADDLHIKNTLTYDRASKLYSRISNLTEADVALINKATEKDHRIKLNNLNGATWKTLLPILKEKGIDPRVFDDPEGNHEVMWEQENGLFSAGYYVMKITETYEENTDGTITVTQKTDGKISKKTVLAKGSKISEPSTVYKVGHLGIDTTMKKVVNTIPYPEELKGLPIGTKVYEADPDSDRFVVKQIMPKTEQVIALLDKYGIEYYDLGENRILAAPSPNKIFLALDIMDYERMKADGSWDDYISLYFITYVSTRAWQEFAAKVGLTSILCRVGFKNLNEAEAIIKDWYERNVDYQEMSKNKDILEISDEKLVIKDQLGNDVTIKRYKDEAGQRERIEFKLRTHSKEEESGGRVAGLNKPSYNVLGQTAISMPEKAVPDALMSELFASSKAFLSSDGKKANSRGGEYVIVNFLDSRFKKYDMKSKIDGRFDILHGDEGAIAQMNTAQEKSRAMDIAGANKTNFNNFFFSIGRAVRDSEISLDKAKEMLKKVMPKYSATWDAIEGITQTEEPLSGGRTRPEGVPIIISFAGEDSAALVLEFDFRPSGTDPLKSKIYFDATELSPEERDEAEQYFNALTSYDLYAVLERYGIKPSIEKPVLLTDANLRQLELGQGPELFKASSAGELQSLGVDRARAEQLSAMVQSGRIRLNGSMVDVIDEDDNVIGVIDQNLAHNAWLRHRTSNIVIVHPDNGNILLQQRAKHKGAYPEHWAIYGGHVKAGQTYAEAAEDELKEELGLPEDHALQGKWVSIGKEGSYEYPAGEEPSEVSARLEDRRAVALITQGVKNIENRAFYMYIPSKDEVVILEGKIAALHELRKQCGTEEAYDAELKRLDGIEKGRWEVKDAKWYSLEDITSGIRQAQKPLNDILGDNPIAKTASREDYNAREEEYREKLLMLTKAGLLLTSTDLTELIFMEASALEVIRQAISGRTDFLSTHELLIRSERPGSENPKTSSAGTNLKDLSEYDAERYLATTLLNYSPTGIIEVNKESQAIIVYSDSLKESLALQEIIRQSAGDSRKFFLVNKEQGISADRFLAGLNIDRDIFENYVFQQNSLTADQLALAVAGMLHGNGIKQGRVFASTEEDIAAWSKQGLIEALVMLLKDKRFEIISDYSQQHIEYIRTHEQALIAA